MPIAVFGPYCLLEKLAEGGMAAVFRARYQGSDGFSRIVALKLVHTHLAYQDAFKQWFVREARLGGCLDHPNIVKTHKFGKENGYYFIEMDYVEGPTLADLLEIHRCEGFRFPPDIALQLMIGICAGLEYLQGGISLEGNPLQLVHCDLKPANILISRYGEVKIGDFGVTRAPIEQRSSDENEYIIGTPGYMSPEQAAGAPLDARSDLFCAGIMLFEMLTLTRLYEAKTDKQLLELMIRAEIAPRLEEIPAMPCREVMVDLLARLLARDPDERIPCSGALLPMLEEIRAALDRPVKLKPWLETLEPYLQRLRRRRTGRSEGLWPTPSTAAVETDSAPLFPAVPSDAVIGERARPGAEQERGLEPVGRVEPEGEGHGRADPAARPGGLSVPVLGEPTRLLDEIEVPTLDAALEESTLLEAVEGPTLSDAVEIPTVQDELDDTTVRAAVDGSTAPEELHAPTRSEEGEAETRAGRNGLPAPSRSRSRFAAGLVLSGLVAATLWLWVGYSRPPHEPVSPPGELETIAQGEADPDGHPPLDAGLDPVADASSAPQGDSSPDTEPAVSPSPDKQPRASEPQQEEVARQERPNESEKATPGPVRPVPVVTRSAVHWSIKLRFPRPSAVTVTGANGVPFRSGRKITSAPLNLPPGDYLVRCEPAPGEVFNIEVSVKPGEREICDMLFQGDGGTMCSTAG